MKFEDWRKYRMPEQQVEHPDYYNWFNIECIDVVQHFPFNPGNAIKYIWRAGKKPNSSAINDLRKAKYCIELEIKRLENQTQEMYDNLQNGGSFATTINTKDDTKLLF